MDLTENHDPPSVSDTLIDTAQALTGPVKNQQSWVEAYLRLFGPESPYMKFLQSKPAQEEMKTLFDSPCVRESLTRIAELRKQFRLGIEIENNEAVQVITVRLPRRIHASLKTEALAMGTSLNKLCISKMLAPPVPETIVRGGK